MASFLAKSKTGCPSNDQFAARAYVSLCFHSQYEKLIYTGESTCNIQGFQ